MAFEDYLNDLCDIYHAQKGDESPGYGLTEQPSFSYPKEPDVLSVACHFAVKSESTSISQTAPANIKESRIKLALPTGTDVSLIVNLGDKLYDADGNVRIAAATEIHLSDPRSPPTH